MAAAPCVVAQRRTREPRRRPASTRAAEPLEDHAVGLNKRVGAVKHRPLQPVSVCSRVREARERVAALALTSHDLFRLGADVQLLRRPVTSGG